MNLYDILGPVMVGPSSSHTAGAVRIGLITRRLLGKAPAKADIALAGSFAATGRGHGTDRALAAGLLGMQPDDTRIPDSLLEGVRTLTGNIVMEMGYAQGLHREALIATGVVLFVFILIINLLFSILKRKESKA